ncbi:hypothetical protein D3C85_1296240 [compost metagenome]
MRWDDILAPELGALLYTKTVLFIDNDEAKILELYLIFNQCMGADQDVERALFEGLMDQPTFFGAGRSRE